MFERFLDQARDVVVQAQREARALDHSWIGTEHLLLALLARPDSPGSATLVRLGITADGARTALTDMGRAASADDDAALRAIGVDPERVRHRAEEVFGPGALDRPACRPQRGRFRLTTGHLRFSPRAKSALERALRAGQIRRDRHLGTEHLALGLLDVADGGAVRIVRRLSLDPRAVRAAVIADLGDAAA